MKNKGKRTNAEINKIKNNLIIELHVPDFNKVKHFYGLLGFEEIDYDEPTKEHPAYMVLRRGDLLGETMINFYGGDDRVYNQSYFKSFSRDTKRGYEIEITIPVNNVENFFKEIRNSELKEYIVRNLKQIDEGGNVWKDFRMEDPFGFYLRFTELIDWGQ